MMKGRKEDEKKGKRRIRREGKGIGQGMKKEGEGSSLGERGGAMDQTVTWRKMREIWRGEGRDLMRNRKEM